MDDDAKFWIVYASVMAMRLHPKNDSDNPNMDISKAATVAFKAADVSLYFARKDKWPQSQPEQSQPEHRSSETSCPPVVKLPLTQPTSNSPK